MLIRLILVVGLLGFAYYGYHRINALPPERRKRVWWKLVLGGVIAISLIAVATGRMHWLGGALALLLAAAKFGAHALFRVWPLLRATGQDAVFRTEHLEVRFAVKTSQLQGRVIKGRYEGESLQAMRAEQLQELADLYQNADRKSWYLVRVFIQRTGASQGNFQSQQEQTAGGFPSSPTRDEALLILGLQGNPDKAEIIAAHRKLIQKLHPDRGVNDYLAARVNQAKDVLLG